MKNTFGNNLSVTLFGESHGEAIGCVIDGLAPGIKIDTDYLKNALLQRAARSDISTPRRESDEPRFLSGVKNGITEGTPICILIENENKNSSAYADYEFTPRPSHADLTAEYKYHGYQDKAGGGHFSGRITAPLVAAGAIIRYALEGLGIKIGTHIKSLHGIKDRDFLDIESDIALLNDSLFPALDTDAAERMKSEILGARERLDSVGGVLETVVTGVPSGVGEPWFDTIEGVISHAVFSVPAVKGIEFGDGFALAAKYGSEANDPYRYADGKVVTAKNSNGGVIGGITNGMPIFFRTAIKPTPSISKEQDTVDLKSGENVKISVGGRHDPAIVHRARAVIDAVTAIAIGDLLVTRFGTDFLKG
ncbi:MAG: chorismate synthase [Ruminococcaceae bacterium]|nr:chorismate synthase [Oscillospiraceae bacterium]